MAAPVKKLLLIDGNSITFRAFFALSHSGHGFSTKGGLNTAAVLGFKNMLDHMLAAAQPTHVLVAFDAGKKTFRTKMYGEYKGGRAKTPPELLEQFPYIKRLVEGYGLHHYELTNYEADDIIGTLARQADDAGFTTTIVTGDRDLTQLATAQTTVAVTKRGVTDVEYYTPTHVAEKYGLIPEQVIDMKALAGDSSDNYPGVTKIGEKTAIKLLKRYKSVAGIYAHFDEIKASKMKEHLEEDRETAFLCRDLATIKRDAPIEVTIEDTVRLSQDTAALRTLYQELEFNRALSELASSGDELERPQEEEVAVSPLTLDKVAHLPVTKRVALYVELGGANYHRAPFEGCCLAVAGKYYVTRDCTVLASSTLQEYLKQVIVDVFDAKRTIAAMHRLGGQLPTIGFDLLLVSYLLDSSQNSNDLGIIAQQHGNYTVQPDEAVYGKNTKRRVPDDDEQFFQHLAHKVQAIEELRAPLMTALAKHQQEHLYTKIELPLAQVLAQMEIDGVRVDQQRLTELGSTFTERVATLEQQICQEAGEEFNINSPKQLGHILFEKLNLPVIKKTKTGYSTAVSVLEKLRGMAPIVDHILEYRQWNKLKTTYVDGLMKVLFQNDSKAHTIYTQTLTATGRLSSVDPNLQNIPARGDGRIIRQAFVPSQKGWQIFSSDYSQIELRVLAHISGDKNMQQAFKEDLDVHANTAMRIFGLDSPEDVTPEMRRQAKAVNFGIVYGISDYGLAQNIGISRRQAKQFIETYFAEFPGVHEYMQQAVAFARKHGYVETLLHRRRYLPDIKAHNFNQRSFAERTAMNSPIQGSAADIIKVAMINMHKMLRKQHLQARMLMQVHDELLFEAPSQEIPQLRKFVPHVMDAAVSLDVPLKVESAVGDTWYDVKK
ncbi:DNA polymerase I [Ligilactobacillus sp. LYQ139]|uniref:DNA polymerase I n=1 Tax=Ligilactobacillus sp. LYQ139 TaxID=3378800 RepID=UPI0038533D53